MALNTGGAAALSTGAAGAPLEALEALEPFDVCGPLPGPGVTLLEASAGTGKTFTIASLAVRYLAEGVPVDRLLVVTFTRAATGELRERVRRRVSAALDGLERALAGVAPEDPVVALLAAADEATLRRRRAALERASRRFDSATIATTHSFCEQMLDGLGIAGEPAYDLAFAEDELRDLVSEVADDCYLRRFALGEHEAPPPFSRREAGSIAAAAVANRDVAVEPSGEEVDAADAARRSFALEVRREVDSRKDRLGVISYDDLQRRLLACLGEGASGPAARARLAGRYAVVLVDEFQDTDPVQWAILEQSFAATAALVLIGDPKQAIYSFRGGDVATYLAASRRASGRATLAVNWRSDAGLLAGLDAAFGNAALGHPEIVYRPTLAAPEHATPGLRAPDGEAGRAAPLRLRVVRRDGMPRNSRTPGELIVEPVRRLVVADLVAELGALLASGVRVRAADGESCAADGLRPLHPGDVAVLVKTNREAAMVRQQIAEHGVPAVMLGTDSVFGAPAATAWLELLEALDRPADRSRAARVALGDFVGWSAELVATASDDEWSALAARLYELDAELASRGVAALYAGALRSGDVAARLLGRADGERTLTDLGHVAQLLHQAALDEQLGERSLAGWLRRRIESPGDEGAAEGLSRRLEHDAQAVQVVTIHRSKGLEFPVVLAPFLWHGGAPSRDKAPFVYHGAPKDGTGVPERVLDVGRGSASDRHRELHAAEQRGEALRLAYVALTRARHQVVLWWAPATASGQSPLGRLLFGRRQDGSIAPAVQLPQDDEALRLLQHLAASAPDRCVEVQGVATGPLAARVAGPVQPVELRGPLEVGTFGRRIDLSWRRASYSALVAPSHAEPAAADPSRADALDDEESVADATQQTADAPPPGSPLAAPVPLAALAGGAELGTFVHAVLERLDFAAGDLVAGALEVIAGTPGSDRLPPAERRLLAEALAGALRTPLGPRFGELALAGIARADRLDEVEFELPLAGGDTPIGSCRLGDVADLLERHLPADDPLAGYPDRLRDPHLDGAFRGYLTGSIDLVVRSAAPGGGARFLVADYKTNRLAPGAVTLSAYHYRPAALAEAMMAAHYPLQALLYEVALHRMLRWRLPGYDPAVQLAGVAYLFLRGMTGPDTPRVGGEPCGVFAWVPPPALLEELSLLLARGTGGER